VAGAGGNAHVKVYDARYASLLLSFRAYEGYEGAVNIAAGDIDNDGRADIDVGTKTNASHVKVFSGATGGELFSLIAFEGFNGGVSVAAGDLNGDGYADIVVGTQIDNSHVKAFGGLGGGLLLSVIAFEEYAGRVSVAAGDLNGDGFAEVIVGAIVDSSHVKAFRASDSAEVASFYAYDAAYTGGRCVRRRCRSQPGYRHWHPGPSRLALQGIRVPRLGRTPLVPDPGRGMIRRKRTPAVISRQPAIIGGPKGRVAMRRAL